MDSLHAAWDTHLLDSKNPTLKFALAWSRLRQTLKDLQEKVRHYQWTCCNLD